MDHGLLAVDAQLSTLEAPGGVREPGLDELVHELGVSEPLMNFVAETGEGARPARLSPEALDPAIFAGLLAP
ncbi:MAG: hypothetical protein NVSMB25_19260 [Thermoleophilaceae bacterium]